MKTKLFILFLTFLRIANAQTPNWEWAKSAGGTSYEESNFIAKDNFGNVYITGYFFSTSITFGSFTLTNQGVGGNNNGDIFLVKYDANGNVVWAKGAGGTGNDGASYAATDSTGNVYITGIYKSYNLILGTDTLTNDTTIGTAKMFIAKYDSTGNVIWAKSPTGLSYCHGTAVITDTIGNVYVSGTFMSPSVTFDSTTLINIDGSGNSLDMFLVKYNANNGTIVWAKSAGGIGNDFGYCASVDATGNVYLNGYFTSSSMTIGSTTLTNANTDGSADIFLTKYNSTGNVVWAKSAGGTATEWGYSVITDVSGNIYITGYFASPTLQFGTFTLTNAGGLDLYITKYSPSGNLLWAKNAGGIKDEWGNCVMTDGSGNVYLAGWFKSSSITFGSTILNITDSTANYCADILVVKYDASGNVLWAKNVGGGGFDAADAVVPDVNGNVYLTGLFESPSISFGSSVITNNTPGQGDVFVAKLGSLTTAVEENNSFNRINIFPNPSSGQVNITTSNNIDEVKITDILGQIVYQTKTNEKNISLQLGKAGLYIVTLVSGRQMATRKLIVYN